MEKLLDFSLYNYIMLRVKRDLSPFGQISEKHDQVLCAQETSMDGTPHYHLLVSVPKESVQDSIKYLKAYRLYLNSLGLMGNQDFSLKWVLTLNQAIKYTIKEGCYVQKGFHEPTLKELAKSSYSKFDRKKFGGELTRLEHRVIIGEIEGREFLDQYVNLRLKYGQSYPSNHQLSYIRSILCRSSTAFLENTNDVTWRKLNYFD